MSPRILTEGENSQTIAAVVGFFPHATTAPMDMPVAGMPGLALLTGRMLASGWDTVVIYGAILSFSLGVINLLPISILDGGQAVAAIVKGMTGRFYPARIAHHANLAQTCALVLFIVVVQGVDLIRVVTGNFPGLTK